MIKLDDDTARMLDAIGGALLIRRIPSAKELAAIAKASRVRVSDDEVAT